jgi:hypothetical protein
MMMMIIIMMMMMIIIIMRKGIVQSVQQLATGWMVRGSDSGGGEIFRTRSDRLCGPPSLLHKGYQVSFPGGKTAEAWP